MPGYLLHVGDCLDPVDGLFGRGPASVDHIVTDPPYTAWVHAHGRRGTDDYGAPRPLGFEAITPTIVKAACLAFAHVVRRWVAVFTSTDGAEMWREGFQLAGLEYVRTMAWVHPGSAPQFTGDRPSAGFDEIILGHARLHRHGPRKRWNGGGRPGVYTSPPEGGITERHPTAKPVALMQALVRDFSDRDELICDPFMGCGATGVAAVSLGREFVGWELDPRFYRVAARRLGRVREQLELPIAPAREMRQERLGL